MEHIHSTPAKPQRSFQPTTNLWFKWIMITLPISTLNPITSILSSFHEKKNGVVVGFLLYYGVMKWNIPSFKKTIWEIIKNYSILCVV